MAQSHALLGSPGLHIERRALPREKFSPASLRQESRLGPRRHTLPECSAVRPRAESGLCEREEPPAYFSAEKLRRYRPSGRSSSRRRPSLEEPFSDQESAKGFLRDVPENWWETPKEEKQGGPAASPTRSVVFPKIGSDRADDLALHNPLKRQERLGCGWLCILLEWEGVMVEDDTPLERKSWCMLAEEEGKPQPPGFLLRRADGMKNEQVIQEVLCWARDFKNVKRMAKRRDEIFEELQGGCYRLRPGSKEFVESLKKYDIPVAVLSTRPRRLLERAIEAVGMEGVFDLVVSAEDVHRGKPDPEMFQYAATCLKFIPERCILVGNSNTTVEAGHDAFMKVVAVAGKHPLYELGAADLVVPRLNDLTIVDLKNLADLESAEFSPPELELEPEEEEKLPATKVATRERSP